ncbi:formylglycine-generating enzyme family protein [Nostoc sp. FACHB-280]|uniref:formylglycine-generating enzyme family protein n=1 Tax=Nostoc sp. FACHB-280 TaxID=2692839 RepID=UPI00168BD13B|nr:formylglycine-generating enzyme family protein [Nostoc sp. FACHB-280]MBD2495061.1 formylglycine-generating enzyme family protein [Nostoc sp. FACHB-280]
MNTSGMNKEELQIFQFDVVTVNAQGQEIKREQSQAEYFTEDLGNGISLEMVLIKSGIFIMGSPEDELERYDSESPQRRVNIQQFFLGKYPVTQEQWRVVAGLPQINRRLEADLSKFKGDKRPVERVSWYDAVEFCARLTAQTKRKYRLPSEAEWEYACRGGTATPFYFGETITTELANYNGYYNYGNNIKGIYRIKTTPVGSFPPNSFGLYDMHGNVLEWCLDDWHDNYEGAPTDGSPWFYDDECDQGVTESWDVLAQFGTKYQRFQPQIHPAFMQRRIAVLRGGCWFSHPEICRSASRTFNYLHDHSENDGFRVVCEV